MNKHLPHDGAFDPTVDPLARARYWITVVDDAAKHLDQEFTVAESVAIAQVYATLAQAEAQQAQADSQARLATLIDRMYRLYAARRPSERGM